MEKLLSFAVATAYVVGTFVYADAVILLPVCVFVITPLIAIWFSEEIASFLIRKSPQVRRRPPTFAVRALAWTLLLLEPALPLVIFFISNRRR